MDSNLLSFRKEKDEFWKTSVDSPLSPEQKLEFNSLNYFPENPNLKFEVSLEPITNEEIILPILTSAGDEEPYKRYGKIHFQIQRVEVELTIFKGIEDDHLFLPFKDLTNGIETYGSGRYVEIEEENKKVKIDFNYAYNPYCAYNDNFRCPLTPFENNLKIAIPAGEKKFHN